jgi:glycosyltransferase involved in cell wall biosynthesis
MRIGFNTLYENPKRPTGSHDYNVRLVRAIGGGAHGHELIVFVSGSGEPFFQPAPGNTRLVRCGSSNDQLLLRLLTDHTLLPMAAARERCDVLFAPGNTSPLWTRSPVVLNIKTMQHLVRPDGLSVSRSFYRSKMIARSARHAARIIANSENNLSYIVDLLGVSADKVRVVPEGLDHALFHPHPDPETLRLELESAGHPSPYVLYVSGLWPYKNVETLIRAFEYAAARGAPHHLLIVGEGDDSYRARLLSLAGTTNYGKRIKFAGQSSREGTARLMQGADILVLPSLYESFGRVVTEAMACGTPVIAARATSLPEVVGNAGLLCEPQDDREFGEAILRLIGHGEDYAILVQAGLRRAAMYSWERQAAMTVSVLEEAVV